MKKLIIIALSILLILCACVPASIQQESIVKPSDGVTIPSQVNRIAVSEFADERHDKSSFPNPAIELQEKIINRLVTKKINVMERRQLNKILDEQKLSQSGLIDEKTVSKIGNLLGVDAILVGSIVDYGKVITPVAKLDFICRLIDVKSSKIIFSLEVDARKTNMGYPFEVHREVINEAAERLLNSINR
ncbi:MAG: FlgO family outer membrane protein [Syntrophales bacterium]